MFKNNDWFWFMAKIVFIMLTIFAIIASVVYPIVLAVIGKNALFALYMIPFLVACLIFWALWNLLLSFLLDVKFIRNKLYDESNEGLVENQKDNQLKYHEAKDVYDE